MFVRKMLARALPLTALGLAAWCPAYAVEEPVKADDVYVTATRVEKELQDVPMSVSVMTSEDIKRSPARTIGELLQDVPGVEIRNSGGQGFKRISIRGENPNRVLILIDGQKLVENKSMDGTPLLIDPSNVERVEVIKGPASVLYGSEAIGGVVNIITKKGGDKPIQGEASVAYNGASNGFAESLSAFGGMNGFKYRVSGSYSDQGNLRTPDGEAPNTSFRQKEGSAFLSYDFSDKFTVGGGLDSFKGSIHSGSMEPGYENFAVDVPKWQRDKVYAFAEAKNVTPWLPRVRFDAFWQKNEKEMTNDVNTDPAIPKMPLVVTNNADNRNKQLGSSLQMDWAIGDNHYLITGYDISYDTLKADTRASASTSVERILATGILASAPPFAQQIAAASMAKSIPYTSTAYHEGDMLTNALYAQMESTLPADFTLSYGVRYTWVQSEMKHAEGSKTNSKGTAPYDVGTESSSNNSRPVFNVGLMWSGIPDLTLRATFAQGFRVPSLQEKYVMSAMGGGTILPNPGLKPETSNSYEIGARYVHDGLSVDVAAFYSDADDYIYNPTIDADTDTSRYINVSSAKTHGVELAASYDFECGLTPYASATWMRRKFDYGTLTTWKTGVPEWSGRAGVRFKHALSETVDFNADVYGRFSSNSVEKTESETTHYNNWQTANVAFGFEFGDEKQYTVAAEVLNLFDKRYRQDDSILEPGLHANIKVGMRF